MTSPMHSISESDFILGLVERAKSGAFILTIEALTNARARVNPYGQIFKRATVNGLANWIYRNAVNRQLLREDKPADFKPHPRQWGSRIQGTPLVLHAGETYLEIKVQHRLSCFYQRADGTPIAESLIADYLPPARNETGRQGTTTPVILRDYPIKNILSFTLDGDSFRILHPV